MDALTIHAMPSGLRRPILITAFSGWNDAAESATTAARYLATSFDGRKFAEIDPEEFYHFGLSRPTVRFKAGSETEREIIWPATEFSIAQPPQLDRDLIVGVATEPHLRWKTYCAAIIELARRCEATLVLTLGALLAEVPHTRPVRLSGGAADPETARLLGIKPTRYEGPTGIVGVLNTACRDNGLATASLWANVPHYISGIENPKAALALVRRAWPPCSRWRSFRCPPAPPTGSPSPGIPRARASATLHGFICAAARRPPSWRARSATARSCSLPTRAGTPHSSASTST